MRAADAIVIGAGAAGLAAAIDLAGADREVTLIDTADAVGGKMRPVTLGNQTFDAGPTVLTMRWVFDELFAETGADFDTEVALEPLDVLARHAWPDGGRLDLFADLERTRDAIATFSSADEADRYVAFAERSAAVYDSLLGSFMTAPAPSIANLLRSAGWRGLPDLARISPFTTMWRALGAYFHDPRLQQLFGRYATYCGSSPFSAPATLMLVAHVERLGVWSPLDGMRSVAAALERRARDLGVRILLNTRVDRIVTANGAVSAVDLTRGERLEADAVVFAGDASALGAGCPGIDAASTPPTVPPAERSLSAVTWCMNASPRGWDLSHHNVLFSSDYAKEFADISRYRRTPREPTVYICAQDRLGANAPANERSERLFCLINAPALGDTDPLTATEIDLCQTRMLTTAERCGLQIACPPDAFEISTPTDFARRYPATGGALYGRASHGWRASFQRPGVRTRVPGLYLAGGSVHPGPGVPMAALSGRLAAASLLQDRGSTTRSRAMAISGGISTP